MNNELRKALFLSAASALLAMLSTPAVALTASEVQKLLASDGAAFDTFGVTVSIGGDTVVIGAPSDDDNGLSSGSAYVFTRSGSTWIEQAKLTASDAAAFESFGVSVSIDGDTVVVGAWNDDDNGDRSGSAYVFTRSGSTWTEQAKLTASDGAAGDLFGESVSVDGDTAVIGAYLDDDDGTSSGSAYIFTRSVSTWTEQAKLTASDAAVGDWFGRSVSVDGDTAMIGARLDDNTGSAYVFTRSGSTWTEQAKLTASDGEPNDIFGDPVSIDGDTAVIGNSLDDDNGTSSGSAYVFTRSGSTWTEQAKLTASDGAAIDRFGFSVSIDGDTVVIGARLDDDNGDDSGSAYVFTRSGNTWAEQVKLTASDGAAIDTFGDSVSVDGDTAVIGAPRDDDSGASSGSTYVFSLLSDEEGPITSSVLATPNPVEINTGLTLTANIDDSTTGGSDIASAAYTVDGGAATAMSAQDSDFDEVSEDVTAAVPAFSEAGVHNLCVSGTDAAGNTGDEECVFLAVYDPDGGFVTGGGWIDSPAGAYVADPTLAGKANFGFGSKYKKGKQMPTGTTEFQFQAGDVNFHSDSYDWLVVANFRAQYRGTGTINGMGNYEFMLFAIDENLTPATDTDLFRIKIWDKDNGDAVVYDNELGETDDADPTTQIGGGSIVIHTKGKK